MTSPRVSSRSAPRILTAALLAAPLSLQPVLFDHSAALAQGAPDSFADIVAAARPAVVTVTTRSTGGDDPLLPDLGPDSPFRDFMERFLGRRPDFSHRPRRESGLGSGFVISSDGVIVTNNHVVDKASEVSVRLEDGTELVADVLGVDDKTDLAVLRVDPHQPLPTVEWGDSDALRVGDWVVAIGNPFGLGGSVTAGIVSARGRDINNGPYDDFIQIDAAINRGNSGGPLFNTSGQVVGVNTAIFSPNGGNIGLGFAIPANQAREIVAKLVRDGHVERGRIGVAIQSVTSDIAEGLGLEDARGALVASVDDGGPAGAAGVRPGDVILAYGGQRIDEIRDLTRAVAATNPGETESLTVWRMGEEQRLDVVVGSMDDSGQTVTRAPQEPMAPSGPDSAALSSMGVELGDLNAEARARYGLDVDAVGALVTSVAPNKSAAEQGVREGDLILAVGQTEVATAAEAEDLIAEAAADGRKTVTLLIERDGDRRFVAVSISGS